MGYSSSDVIDRAAPMMKVSTASYPNPRSSKRYENPIGTITPVAAAQVLRRKYFFRRSSLAVSPPSEMISIKLMYPTARKVILPVVI